ncbi:hypothetical protein CGLO_01135 [Colletotrichum gloeosporioides Cg-14]|uniref:Uncharacterized protein n=1 Tax=Colletotrichum gloeosporioides (strain Cg-14) TaxID=1237896 RepID=T0M4X7_COLGC|nr:hypothetical protein CGLO_01135 [Colletotrichum gloeosporioides Cg-14]
MQRIRVIETLY